MHTSTIAAIATPPGTGGIGIIRISGPDAMDIAFRIFRRNADAPAEKLKNFVSHRLYHGYIIEPSSGTVADEVLLAVMKGPRSFTAEDVVEIQAHAGFYVLRKLLDIVLQSGAELAEPGEFTKRAFLNGRIDLTQAEAVIDTINARTDKALEMATSQMSGSLKIEIEKLRQPIIDILTEIEASIDFPDDVDEDLDLVSASHTLHKIASRLTLLCEHYDSAGFLREGLNLVIAGAPNVGKSSLMNCLIKKDRSIVTSVPGTTRDLIEDSLNLRGIPFVVTDTAGIHSTQDMVENIGIDKAKKALDNSDLILFVVDGGRRLDTNDFDIYNAVADKKKIIVINKTDLIDAATPFEPPESWSGEPLIRISVKKKFGMETLKKEIINQTESRLDTIQTGVIPNLRHRKLISKAAASVQNAANGIDKDVPAELTAIDLTEALTALDNITGISASPDLLDEIFSSFCIGK